MCKNYVSFYSLLFLHKKDRVNNNLHKLYQKTIMSELILLRNKIKTIQTIQKITHTMRLIAMSGHTALRKKESNTYYYIKAIQQALKTVSTLTSPGQEHVTVDNQPTLKTLCIVIGSQKGLCGSFNTQLEHVFMQYQNNMLNIPFDIALIGTQIIKSKIFSEPLLSKHQRIVYQEQRFSQKTSSPVLDNLKNMLAQYSNISIISNYFRSFFVQEALITTLFPINNVTQNSEHSSTVSYICDESSEILYNMLLAKYIHAQLSFLLYQSLLSEHAARFASMDAANRNAKAMLDETKIKYNKLRQAKITTEINELSANFSQN
jgi:F-type H+-transporting ATPase subunit gamma